MKEEKSVLGLSTIRRNRGISLEQIADSTKIGIRSLEAIEQGDFRKLPGGIYNTSYIRQYARAIGFPVAVKLASHRILHKTEMGGVHLNLVDEQGAPSMTQILVGRTGDWLHGKT